MKKIDAMVKVQELKKAMEKFEGWASRDLEKMNTIEEKIADTEITLTKKKELAKIYNDVEKNYRRNIKAYAKNCKKWKALKRKFAI